MLTAEEFNSIDFGRLDAESDPKLLEYFLVTGTVDRATSGAQLVIGRKGSGKTALFRHLAKTLDTSVVELDLVDYVFGVHKALVDVGLAAERAFVASWKILIYSAMFATLHEGMHPYDRDRAEKALKALGLGENGGGVAAIWRWLRRVRRVDLPSVLGTGGGGLELSETDKGVLAHATVQALDELEDAIKEAVQKAPVTVLVDRLDDAWDGEGSSLDLIGGAIRATRDIALALGQRRPAPVITFLRTDLWERLSFNDKNKMSQDIIYLDWTPEELVRVIDLRIGASVGRPEAGWDDVFTTEEMRQRAASRTYITKRALGRPRDIVAFSIFAKQAADANAHQMIETSDIYEGERDYSKHVFGELRDEIERHVDDFTAVTNTMKTIGKRNFTPQEWYDAAKSNGLTKPSAEAALEQLFEAGAVGVHGAGGAKGGSGTTFRYQDRMLRWSPESTLQVHLALVRELGLKDA